MTRKGTYPHQTIALDCAPGALRPGDLIAGVIAGTSLPRRKDCARFFGEWTWDYSDIDPHVWKAAHETLRTRIAQLYHAGMIRYGELGDAE